MRVRYQLLVCRSEGFALFILLEVILTLWKANSTLTKVHGVNAGILGIGVSKHAHGRVKAQPGTRAKKSKYRVLRVELVNLRDVRR